MVVCRTSEFLDYQKTNFLIFCWTSRVKSLFYKLLRIAQYRMIKNYMKYCVSKIYCALNNFWNKSLWPCKDIIRASSLQLITYKKVRMMTKISNEIKTNRTNSVSIHFCHGAFVELIYWIGRWCSPKKSSSFKYTLLNI
jgi:hypothetical protein